jgi:hypothetical protein
MEDRAGCAPGRLPAPSQEIWLWNTGQAVTPAPPGPTQARRCDCGARAGCGSPRQSGRWDCGARGKLPARQTRLPRPQDCRTQVGLSPPPNKLYPHTGDGIVEYGAGCGSRPDMLGSPDPGRWSCRTQARSPPPADCALMREIGLWGTGRAVPPPPGAGGRIVGHGAGCAPTGCPPPLRRYDCGTRGKL